MRKYTKGVLRNTMSGLALMACLGLSHADETMRQDFANPPDAARPWVYWYFSDGNLTRDGMRADLEAMKRAGIGGAICLEVDIGMPRGTVKFMSPEWQELIKEAGNDAERLGLSLALAAGPGWCGSGGPWVTPEHSMQHLVASETKVTGPLQFSGILPQPPPRVPFFGVGGTPEMIKERLEYYRDEAVIAYPTPKGNYAIPDVNEKALYFRAPYSSAPGVKPRMMVDTSVLPVESCIPPDQVMELKGKMAADGRLTWDVPAGEWTIMRMGRTITGQTTRPAPLPGLGWESGKFDKASFDAHFDNYFKVLLKTIGKPDRDGKGFTQLHFDSWEMSSQNWSAGFREAFKAKRGYDPVAYLPAMLGKPIGSVDIAERFLWDLRRTAQELVRENHIVAMKKIGHDNNLVFSIEPYDLNPAGDLLLGGEGDIPMCEFWSKGYGFSTEYSCFEAVSAAHTNGRKIVGAEAFTSDHDQWRQYPWAMKQQNDWALCNGINRLTFHRFSAQPVIGPKPGLNWGRYGVHWDSTQTWWEMAEGYHLYLTRSQALLRRGVPVVDVLYLDVEDAPAVFTPPPSALLPGFPDHRGFSFDGCAPDTLLANSSAKDGEIVFPGGMSYRLLVLPSVSSMSLPVMRKIKELVKAGVTVVGTLPQQSPGLVGYPQADAEVKKISNEISHYENFHRIASTTTTPPASLYPTYEVTAGILMDHGIKPDFSADADLRFIHRREADADLYFVGNRTNETVSAKATFRVTGMIPERWDPVTGATYPLPEFQDQEGHTVIPLRFAPAQGYFVIFHKEWKESEKAKGENFPPVTALSDLSTSWSVTFDPEWGGPEQPLAFTTLEDWTKRPEDGVKYYSGTAIYRKNFDASAKAVAAKAVLIDLGMVHAMARVILNGMDLGVVWCAPWQIAVPPALLKDTGNELRIEVANLWPNRLIKDAGLTPEKRISKSAWYPYKETDPLLPSGLLGPVRLLMSER